MPTLKHDPETLGEAIKAGLGEEWTQEREKQLLPSLRAYCDQQTQLAYKLGCGDQLALPA